MSHHRRLVLEGPLMLYNKSMEKPSERFCLLLSDLLIIAKPMKRKKGSMLEPKYRVEQHISLGAATISDLCNIKSAVNLLRLTLRDHTLNLGAMTPEIKDGPSSVIP